MIEIGKYNELRILRETSVGLYLGDESGEDVLLPNKYCPESFKIDDKINVFVYRDYAERKIATNLTPKITLNDFALLQVTAVADVGAFMDWGLEKDLLVPFSEQRERMEEGRWYIVYLAIDENSDRLYGSNMFENIIQNRILTVQEGEEIELMILQKTDLGFSALINYMHKGMIFENEIFRKLNIGDKLKGFVKKIREDKKIDISLHPIGYDNSNDKNSALVYNALVENKGFLSISDKSSPDEIYAKFGISKKAYKRAISALYKQRKISIQTEGIKLIP